MFSNYSVIIHILIFNIYFKYCIFFNMHYNITFIKFDLIFIFNRKNHKFLSISISVSGVAHYSFRNLARLSLF